MVLSKNSRAVLLHFAIYVRRLVQNLAQVHEREINAFLTHLTTNEMAAAVQNGRFRRFRSPRTFSTEAICYTFR